MKIHYSFFVALTHTHTHNTELKPCLYFVNSFVREVWKVNFLGYFATQPTVDAVEHNAMLEEKKNISIQQTIIMLIITTTKKKAGEIKKTTTICADEIICFYKVFVSV